ncbi:diacylglycerol acyltransferase-domain-containing protein [Aspergillus pseudoustus]|uniref:Diacylglycerol O-acyltransferase n=1 Tax=Aspergillus pseudoustus TaxID=1810923 RepID=A0ABR4KIC8_9EURO
MAVEDIHGLVGYNQTTQRLYNFEHPSHPLPSKQDPGSGPLSHLQKGLQTLAVFYHVITIYPLLPGVIIAAYACYNPARVVFPILLSLLLPRSYSRRSDFLRCLPIWRLVASYFPLTLYRTTPLPPNQKYIFGYHPHGILSHGAFAAFATESLGFFSLFPGIENSLLTLESSFKIPIYRDYLLLLGMNSVSRSSCERILSNDGTDNKGTGRAITIVIGGAKESLEAAPGSMRLVLRHRKGFAKLAIRTGASLVPVLAFGENELYTMTADLDPKTLSGRAQQAFKRVFGLTVPFLYSKGPYTLDFGLTPHRRPVNIVVGRPIAVKKMEDPIDERYLDEVHARYIEELERIWYTWKGVFAPESVENMKII